MQTAAPKIILVGNPNVGKSVVFGYLTGTYATVSNYPGTTVAVRRGEARIEEADYEVIDTPGVHSLIPMSEDECVTRDLLLKNRDANNVIVQIADAKNLARSLPLTFQLRETGLRMILAVNMWDEADRAGMVIDVKKLEEELRIPVVATVAVRKAGLPLLKRRLKEASTGIQNAKFSPDFEGALQAIESALPPATGPARPLACMLLAGDRHIREQLKPQLPEESRKIIEDRCRRVASQFAEPVSFLMHQERKTRAQAIVNGVVKTGQTSPPIGNRISAWALHPVWGLFILAGILELVYLFVGKFGAGTAVDFIENGLFAKYVSPGALWLVEFLHPPKFLADFLVGPYGQVTMGLSYAFAIVLPIVTTFFIAFSLMEDSGYLPRLAVMVNRLFKGMGLNGKAVLPMVLGLGCDTMATLTTRILETRKQRLIVTLLLALAVPCSAQLGVLLGMFGTMPAWTFWVWLSVMGGVMFFVGFASNKIIAGEAGAFVMEIPPLRIPRLGNVAKKTISHLEWYVKEAIPLFLLGTAILFLLDAIHLLDKIQKVASPLVVKVLGLPAEASNAFLIGFLRRDYGATGFFDMYRDGKLSVVQSLIALVVITLFVPCIANVFMIVKEHGGKVAAWMVGFIFPFAFFVGGVLHWVLK